ncbi:small RNA 2'-O-methyltransferase [Protopterus annectens]|uniref:small RNA 2'-O-methyltransferase n=1 Tax=Protopterus annectens TaxID=7888 RepID=UPI001CFB8FE2|nr:small RNA 2'-O-methyltransferase [Protopterus annectens]XP_043942003.1 small RNA 2'-O-methyltransferase [Protopterus annectens]
MDEVTFSPPLYKQRHQFIKDLVWEHKPKKVADLGCADCSLLWKLKFFRCIELLVGLDIDANVMQEKMYRLSPLPGDYVQPRERPLKVALYQGSVTEKDPCLLGFDLVTCIEIIEHLEETQVATFTDVVFGYMSPAMVVISTPNAEFNPLLPGLTGFRHKDHKFEWTKAQFQKWALDAAYQHGYTVKFSGVGVGPPGTEEKGFCTQIGLFTKKVLNTDDRQISDKKQLGHLYKPVFEVSYPSLQDMKYLRHAVILEVTNISDNIKRSLMNSCYKKKKNSCDSVHISCLETGSQTSDAILEPYISDRVLYIPLARLLTFPKLHRLCDNIDKLKEVLADRAVLSKDGSCLIVVIEIDEDWDCYTLDE